MLTVWEVIIEWNSEVRTEGFLVFTRVAYLTSMSDLRDQYLTQAPHTLVLEHIFIFKPKWLLYVT